MATPTLLCDAAEDLIVYVAGNVEPSEADWDGYIELLRCVARENQSVRVVVFADGPPPTALQRKSLAQLARSVEHQSAVITDRVAARAVVTALRWWGVNVRPFATAAIAEAFAHLELTPSERSWLTVTQRGFRMRLAGRKSSLD